MVHPHTPSSESASSESGLRWIAEKSAGVEPEAAPVETPAYPPLATQAANLAGALGRFVASGLANVVVEEYDRRRVICEACPREVSGPSGH
ncbi:hypothetical protein [Planctomyces sp. SH-PL62]|uniref:hypothetical protein n=1 Tax=Planctomyces sp. SH-PL62 TaxID=1636152 RepID=UPI000837EF73|nr:hypothetical protein [Planctomyces sp. SH-PL62]